MRTNVACGWRLWGLVLALTGLCWASGCEQTSGSAANPALAAAEDLSWDDLMPPEWNPQTLFENYSDDELMALDDADPRAQALYDKLQALWTTAPVVPEMEGRTVRLPGFVVPLDWSNDAMTEFLLVPYYGACIHVPPPPANQVVNVVTPTGHPYLGGLFDPIWVVGVLHVRKTTSDLASSGYSLDLLDWQPYTDEVQVE